MRYSSGILFAGQELDAAHPIVDPGEHVFPFRHVLLHFFNHQTHHRGQLTTLIKQAGYEPGVTDLMWLPGVER